MKAQIKKYLYDVINSANEIIDYTTGMDFSDYAKNKLVQRAVERNFEIIGEALNKVKFFDDEVLIHIKDSHKIIGFRNILIHGYSEIDEKVVWSAIAKHLSVLKSEINHLLNN